MLDKVKILRDLVVVQAVTQKKKAQGFAMPEEETGVSGRVVAFGPDVTTLQVGALVYFGNESKQMTIKGQDFIVMELNNVIGTEEEISADQATDESA